jgi:hypothetical protein
VDTIDKLEMRKYSLMKEREAESKMMANIEFLKSVRGPYGSLPIRNEWKQPKLGNRNALAELKGAKHKQIKSVGLTNSLSWQKLQETTPLPNSPTVPAIKASKKKTYILKPVAFSLYSIRKRNEMFYNKLVQ